MTTRRARALRAVPGVVLAAAVGTVASGFVSGSAAKPTGVAESRVVVDTPAPLAGARLPIGAGTITRRSIILADSMQTAAMTAAIAGRAGLRPAQLTVVGPAFDPVSVSTLLPDGELPELAASAAQTAVYTPAVVRLSASYDEPLVRIDTVAPDARRAASLAQATVAAMQAAAASTQVPPPQPVRPGTAPPIAHAGVRVEQLGDVRSMLITSSSRHLRAAAGAAIATLLIWLVGLVATAQTRRRRAVA